LLLGGNIGFSPFRGLWVNGAKFLIDNAGAIAHGDGGSQKAGNLKPG